MVTENWSCEDLLQSGSPPAAGLPYSGYLKKFVAGASFLPGESTIAAGDILGCGFSRPEDYIFCTRNGKHIGVSQDASKLLSSTMARLRPVVYMTLKNHHNTPIPPELHLGTTANFGQDSFAFDMAHFAEGYLKQRRQRFECSAGSLPDKIITMITILAAEIIVGKEDM
ncbi:uncharacterized protein PHACADRAFT_29181 [Phanerochaete carnosa HHB-10118-sp]|uniref:SPRY domain-containing protein n=1 Tax=Phanerochaete carnosa (strain HHB-10118-sp) TaxID=650164 RepID=K5UV58_PHACS|nr:uncharacterized protein PHACADRAFT_29181 [Phanerochaete carnosa HHB-10118-sp]EKM53871.1 hypothetical protein PHACADRAFT_29181 [Phanerochaete carnosa HHB-10118-sp]